MKKPYEHKAPLVRSLLKANIEGLTAQTISLRLGADERHIYRVLNKMPDAYIASWTEGKYVAAIWRVAYVPPHCPPPLKKDKTKRVRTK
jgi:DNA invertase Pin-like site-specific DNA recombinase